MQTRCLFKGVSPICSRVKGTPEAKQLENMRDRPKKQRKILIDEL
jgi:hypothetical protein